MQKTSKNKALKMHLAELRARAVLSKTPEDIEKAAQVIRQFNQSAKYSFNYTWSYIGIALGVLMFSLGMWSQMDFSGTDRLWVQAGGAALALGSIAVILLRMKAVKQTGAELYIRAAAIQAGIVRDYDFQGYAYWQQLRSLFSLFDCGDEGQSITKRYLGGVDNTPFTLFEFKYVNVTRSTSTDSNGNTRNTETRRTLYKYGMIVQFEQFNYLSLNVRNNANGLSEKWDSSSRMFNKLFKVRCASPIMAAKFFDPKTVLEFEDSYSFVKSLDVNSKSVACIELPSEVFPTQMETPKLQNTEEYLQHLQAPSHIPVLVNAKKLIQCINEQK